MLIKSKDIINETVRQINDFQTGKIKPLKTGKSFIDDSLLGGLRPSDVLGICGLPFMGKSYLLEEILMFMEQEYPGVIFVHGAWEVEFQKYIVRQLSKGSGKSVKEVLNTEPDKETKKRYSKILERYRKDNIYLEPPVTYKDFSKDISEIIDKHKKQKVCVVIDNAENLLLDGEHQKQCLDSLFQSINVLKKNHKFIVFIILNQLNRELESRTIADNPKQHFPRESDLYGSSSMFKLCDCLLVRHIPYRFGIERYGVFGNNRYTYLSDEFKNIGANTSTFRTEGLVFTHILKARNVDESERQDVFIEKIFESDKNFGGKEKREENNDQEEEDLDNDLEY